MKPNYSNMKKKIWIIQSLADLLTAGLIVNGFTRQISQSTNDLLISDKKLIRSWQRCTISHSFSPHTLWYWDFIFTATEVISIIQKFSSTASSLKATVCSETSFSLSVTSSGDSHPESTGWIPLQSQNNCSYQINKLCSAFLFSLSRAPMGSHSSTVSHDMSTHLEVIQSDLLGVLDQLPFPLHSREENQMALTLQGQIR